MPATPDPSPRFLRAALTERDRLLRQREKAEAQVLALRGQLQEAEDRRYRLDERISGLQDLVGEPAIEPPSVRLAVGEQRGDDRRLRASAIREKAIRVLLASGHASQPIHYRDWLHLLEKAGYEISGKRPDAVFLNQIVRSPVVKSTTKPGIYELDWHAPKRLREQLDRLQSDLRAGSAREAIKPDALEELTLEIRRTQRALQEATDALNVDESVSAQAA